MNKNTQYTFRSRSSNDHPAGGHLVMVEQPDGTPSDPLPHIVRHSPTGYTWRYAGSGPADLARNLLIAALGDDARCPDCAGTRKIVYDVA